MRGDVEQKLIGRFDGCVEHAVPCRLPGAGDALALCKPFTDALAQIVLIENFAHRINSA